MKEYHLNTATIAAFLSADLKGEIQTSLDSHAAKYTYSKPLCAVPLPRPSQHLPLGTHPRDARLC